MNDEPTLMDYIVQLAVCNHTTQFYIMHFNFYLSFIFATHAELIKLILLRDESCQAIQLTIS